MAEQRKSKAGSRPASRKLPVAAKGPAPSGAAMPLPRVVIEAVKPEVDAGRFAIKRVVGESVSVQADIFAEGHDCLAAIVLFRRIGTEHWQEVTMAPLANDRWEASFPVAEMRDYEYTLEAWVDRFRSYCIRLKKKFDAEQDVASELLEGAELVRQAANRAGGADGRWVEEQAGLLAGRAAQERRVSLALSVKLAATMALYPDRDSATRYERVLRVHVDRPRARFSAWYEMFPRSCAAQPGKHGTLSDCERRIAYVASMGFDVLYLPPVHPIGSTHRKGRNNSPSASPDDPGSPWAIGSSAGGHVAIHPELGTLADFDRLVEKAREQGVEVALDLAFQCSPDHPYVREHPEWFRWRPDGTIQYAENPPKKYQDIFPLEFENAHWQELWAELLRVVRFWVDRGVSIFRVDNPHTKPFAFWEWLIAEVRKQHADVIFLAEAFTRPKVMQRLAKIGFAQSYSYFTWRNTKDELIEYFSELARGDVRETMRPNLFANTPDILHEYLQSGGRPAFQIRLVLAATLGASYGIYGPAFELCEGRALPDSEEYLDSEKFQIRHWDLDAPHSLRAFIARVNQIRRDNLALQRDDRLRFSPVDNERLIFYGKTTPDLSNILLVVVNLDPHHTQAGWVEVPLTELGLDERQPYQVHDLLGDARYLWHGSRNYVSVNPHAAPAHIFRVRRRVRTERDFDYFL
jgi:starch synthase (maltosyl-transferring)